MTMIDTKTILTAGALAGIVAVLSTAYLDTASRHVVEQSALTKVQKEIATRSPALPVEPPRPRSMEHLR